MYLSSPRDKKIKAHEPPNIIKIYKDCKSISKGEIVKRQLVEDDINQLRTTLKK